MTANPSSFPADPAPAATVTEFPRDRLGRAFNADKFRANDDGSPFLNTRGEFMPRGGRKPAATAQTPPAGPTAPPAPDFGDIEAAAGGDGAPDDEAGAGDQPHSPPDEYMAAAAATVGAMSTLAILAMGKHVSPSNDEVAAMVRAYAECYRHYGYAPETPPWLGPVLATGIWLAPHLQDNRSQSKLQGWKIRLGAMWARLRGRRDARAATAAARDAREESGL